MTVSPDIACLAALPPPLCDERFGLLKHGIFDNSAIDVYVNSDGDFAFLSPAPEMDYREYIPRHKTLGLSEYKKTRRVIESRYSKLESCFAGASSVLEFGAADGAFLAHLRAVRPSLCLAAVEPDESTRPQRDHIANLLQFASLELAIDAGVKVDIVCLFHVFEHLADPASWLASVKQLLRSDGTLIIEVPSLQDPLLSLYRCEAYREFYFQKQHPFVYAAQSLSRVLSHHGFYAEIIPYQRYGLENHLAWLSDGKPGGNPELRNVFQKCEAGYVAALEADGHTDTVFAIAKVKT